MFANFGQPVPKWRAGARSAEVSNFPADVRMEGVCVGPVAMIKRSLAD